MTMAMMALAFTACTEEDLMQPTQGDAGTLHIASVTIDGQQVVRSRVAADGGTYAMNELPYNQSFNGFIKGDALQLTMTNTTPSSVYAIYNGTTWTISDPQDGTIPVTIQPAEDKKWADVGIEAAFGGNQLSGSSTAYSATAAAMGVVQGDIDVSNSLILGDRLVASTGNGVSIDTDVKSPTLGATTIQLKHANALLRLPKSAAGIEEDTYIVNGTAHNVTGLATLWAVVKNGSIIQYFPLTEVGDNLQAIVPAATEGIYTLTGFKGVMNTSEEGKTVTIDLPFKVGTSETHDADGIALQPNYRYPLTLTIAPHTASVTLTSEMGKPGWGTDEEELNNEMNDNPYILGSATSVDEVKSILEACIAAGKTTITVKGETLAAYSDDNSADEANTVVGEAIRQLTLDSDGNPDANSWNMGTISLELPNVTSIGASAFSNCDALTSVSLPAATAIEHNAFENCDALTSVSLPAVTAIGNYAFRYCYALTSLSLPAATTIGQEAFYGCATLTSLTFGSVIMSVGDNAFNGTITGESTDWTTQCALTLNIGQQSIMALKASGNTWATKNWASISYVDDEGNAVNIIDGSATDVATVKDQIIAALTGISTIVVMGNLTQYNNGTAGTVVGEAIRLLTTDEEGNLDYRGKINLMLPETTEIAQSAFEACEALASVSAPKLEAIGERAFVGCTSLVSVEFPETTEIAQSAFVNCKALASVSAPKLEAISDGTFGSCTSLVSVEFPKVTAITNSAFSNCTSLTYLTLGTEIKHVGKYAFGMLPQENWSTKCALTLNIGQQNSTLEPDGNKWAGYTWASISYVNDDGNAVIDGTAKEVATVKAQIETAINTRRSAIIVTGVTLKEYSGVTGAKTVVGQAIYQLMQNGNETYKGTVNLVLPNATAIGDYAFSGCTALTSVSLPAATTIGQEAFYGCATLTSLTFGSVIMSVGDNAFNGTITGESTDWTTQCALTLNIGQQNSTNYPVGTDGNGKPTWAGKTWASITLK